MSKALKLTFLIHAAVSVVFGVPMLFIPGRFLKVLQWTPIDPIVGRLLGAALLGLAWSSFRGWRATERAHVAILIETEAIFTVLGCVGLLRHLLFVPTPTMAWPTFAILAIFAVAWIVFLFRK